ncbi:hypothetical protein GCM10027418_08580 [Mariniluteicoccus endophyticus]
MHTLAVSPEIQAKADALRQEIQREAQAQQGAIADLFGDGTPPAGGSPKRPRRGGNDT